MLTSWVFWLSILLCAILFGVLLSWLEKKSRKKLFIGQPAKYPADLVQALKIYFETQNNIKAVYLAQIYNGEKNEPPHPIIGIETIDEFDRIQREAGKIAEEVLKNGEFADCIQLGEDEVSVYMKNQTEPFYNNIKTI